MILTQWNFRVTSYESSDYDSSMVSLEKLIFSLRLEVLDLLPISSRSYANKFVNF